MGIIILEMHLYSKGCKLIRIVLSTNCVSSCLPKDITS